MAFYITTTLRKLRKDTPIKDFEVHNNLVSRRELGVKLKKEYYKANSIQYYTKLLYQNQLYPTSTNLYNSKFTKIKFDEAESYIREIDHCLIKLNDLKIDIQVDNSYRDFLFLLKQLKTNFKRLKFLIPKPNGNLKISVKDMLKVKKEIIVILSFLEKEHKDKVKILDFDLAKYLK